MSRLETICCPLCNEDEAEQVFHLSDVVHGTVGEWLLVQCRHCTLLYLNPRPTFDTILEHYPEEYGPYQSGTTTILGKIARRWKTWQQRPRVRAILEAAPPGTRLLDLGCATGLLLVAMKKRGWQVSGLELNTHVASQARQEGLTIYDQPLEELELPTESVDVVTMFDVLEHLHDPVRSLQEIYRILTDQGVLIAGMPNGNSLDRKLFGKWWIGFDAPRHLTVFTPKTLTEMVDKAGFEVERLYCFYGRYTVFALSIRVWLRGHMKAGRRRNAIERLLFFPLWRWLSYPLFYLIDRMGYGSVMTIVARKRNVYDS